MDDNISLAELREAVRRFVAARSWESYHTPKNLAMSIAIEAAELMEHFQWRTTEEVQTLREDEQKRQEIGSELADILIYCLSFANATGLDVSDAILSKLERNEKRFPPGRYNTNPTGHRQKRETDEGTNSA